MENKAEILDDVVVATPRVEINKDNKSVIICVYGTLRQGEGNYNRILKDTNSEYLGTFKSKPAYTMYGRRAGFPILTEGTTSITYEAFKINDANVLERMHSLEGCSGTPGDPDNWYDITPIETPVGPGWIYLQHNFTSVVSQPITTGDWKTKSL